MPHFQQTCEAYYMAPVICISPHADVHDAYLKMMAHGINSLAVVNDVGVMLGVLSLTDLLRIGTMRARLLEPRISPVMTFPRNTVEELMTVRLLTVRPDETLKSAAQKMIELHRHRVFVLDYEDQLVGVLSCRDLMVALRDARGTRALAEFMTSPVSCIEAEQSLAEATERLESAHVSGIVVLEEGLPVGSLTHRDILMARELPHLRTVNDALNSRILVLPAHIKLYRAAALAAALKVRRVVAMDHEKVVGILTGLDFARAVVETF